MTVFDESRFSDLLAMSPLDLAETIESDLSMGWLVSELSCRMSARFVEIYEAEFGICRLTRKHAATLLQVPGDPAGTEEAFTYLQARTDMVSHCLRRAAHLVFLFADRQEVRSLRRIRRFASKFGLCRPQSGHDRAIDTTYFRLSAAGNALEGLLSQSTLSFRRMCSYYIAAESHARYSETFKSMDDFHGYAVGLVEFRNMLSEALDTAPGGVA